MNPNVNELQEKIGRLKNKKKTSKNVSVTQGYNLALAMMTDLLSCVLVGLAIGLLLQKIFHTSPLLTAGLTLLGGIAGLYSVIRFAINEDKRNSKC